MVLNQDVITNMYASAMTYLSYLSDKYLNMLKIDDVKTMMTEDKLMYYTNLMKTINNYSYSSGYFTDAQLLHIIGQLIILSDELPNNAQP